MQLRGRKEDSSLCHHQSQVSHHSPRQESEPLCKKKPKMLVRFLSQQGLHRVQSVIQIQPRGCLGRKIPQQRSTYYGLPMSGPIVARIVSLTECKLTWEMSLWACLCVCVGGVVLIMLIEVERPAYHRQCYSLGRGSRAVQTERDLNR